MAGIRDARPLSEPTRLPESSPIPPFRLECRLVSTTHALPPAAVPPQNLEAEEAVLGAMLLSDTAIGAVTEIIGASDYYRGSHGTIHRACLGLWGKGEPVDAITLANELEERGELEQVGGAARIAELAALVSATATSSTTRGSSRRQHPPRTDPGRPGDRAPGPGAARGDGGARRPRRADRLRPRPAAGHGDFDQIGPLLTESFERITKLYEAGST